MTADGVRARVTDTQKKAGDVFAHSVTVEQGALKVGTALALDVDHARRSDIRRNHSATHLLHEALREVLGDHVAQKGSLVATRLMALEDARASGARALFGEKYGDEVRVVAMGETAGGNALGWSVELCGGTHVARTGDIGLIFGLTDSGGAAGVRMVGDVKLMARALEGIDVKDLKSLADEGKKQLVSGVVALVGVSEDGKASLVVGVTSDLTARFSAVDLARKGGEVLGGKGGGRPDMAQAGGPNGA